MIHLKLHNDKLAVFNNDRLVYEPCESGLVGFIESNKLTIFDRLTVKRAVKLIQGSYLSEKNVIIKMITANAEQITVLNDDNESVNNIIKSLGLVDIVNSVYDQLKNRIIHPAGKFDKCGRWYADNSFLINCRTPSRAWPYSQMQACRTLKYVKKCAVYFNCKNESDLLAVV